MVEGEPDPPPSTGQGPNPATPPRSGGDQEGAREDVEGRGDEGERAQQVTPPLGDESNPGQTQTPAAPEDVGVPPDEEMNRPDE